MQAVVAAFRDNERFVITSHEAPDGDALGSLLAAGLALRELGKDVVMFLGVNGYTSLSFTSACPKWTQFVMDFYGQ
jgi:nanoRNase/pAp phosphatase (c-di-AMP/oligoRNAs hydrolase)